MKSNKGKIIIYKTKNGQTKLEVSLKNETVWLSLNQLTKLLGRDKSVISRHIKNIFREGELERDSVVAKFATTATDGKIYDVEYYNLDAIISVGYRVKSMEGTKFRIWATKILKQHLVKGFTINEKRLEQQREMKLQELERVIQLFQNARQSKLLSQGEADGLLQVITEYANSWLLLQKFDEEKLQIKKKGFKTKSILDYEMASSAIEKLKFNLIKKKQAADIFGKDRGHGLEGILGNINQTFGGKQLYPSAEEKAAHLYILRHQRPPVCGRKQANWVFLVCSLLATEQDSLEQKRRKENQRQCAGGAGAFSCPEQPQR